MNTTLKITVAAIAVVAVLAVLGVGFAFAQAMTPWGYGMMGNGYGMMGGFGQNGDATWMQTMHQWMQTTGARSVHTVVWGSLADTLGLTQDELNAELSAGKTLAQIADAQGVSQTQLAAALETSVKAGLDRAIAEGALTQAQADWMLSQMAGRYEWMLTHMGTGTGFGPGGCHGTFTPQNNS